MKMLKILTSGTAIDKAAKPLIGSHISKLASVSYTECLMVKHGHSSYFNEEYLEQLDKEKDKHLIKCLSRWTPGSAAKSLSYLPNINFFKLVLPKKHRDMIHSLLEDYDLTGWSKMLADVSKNSAILKLIIQGLWGRAPIKDDIINTLNISNAIGKQPKVLHFFVGCQTNKEMNKLADIFKNVLGDNTIIRVLSGNNGATNKTSEDIVKADIKQCGEENKDGVVIISREMGSRSFSISEIDAVVLMYDNGSVSSLVQKTSRSLTGGLDFYGNPKKEGNIISMALDPNRVDSVDLFLLEESLKNKQKDESFNSVIRRIRKSVNIFVIDDNGDKHELLQNDEYYSEFIDKFNYNKLKNSQINLIPALSNKELLEELLNVKNSNTAKASELKEKQLKGKGKKYLDSDGNEGDNGEKEKEEVEFTKKDIEVIKEAVTTITNSLLSIVAIDDSIRDKSKTFRMILNSIDQNVDKTKEFYELFGVRPTLAIKLMDKEVINESIIDVCISEL
jgi:hypothetical protein